MTGQQGEAHCAPQSMGVHIYEWAGQSLDNMIPRIVTPGASVPVRFNGFNPGSSVSVTYRSNPIAGDDLVSDENGEVDGTITIPDTLSPGVHRVAFEGTNGVSPRTVEVLIQIEGRPIGGTVFASYFDGFVPFETVNVTYGDLEWVSIPANQDGGVVVDVPLPDPEIPIEVPITAIGAESGVAESVTVAPQPSSAAVWVESDEDDAIDIAGSTMVDGFAHSAGGIRIAGSSDLMSGAEFTTTVDARGGASISPDPVQVVSQAGAPIELAPSDWRPDGVAQARLQDRYHVVDLDECQRGVWTLDTTIDADVIYVPCGVRITGGAATVTQTIVAEGTIDVSGSRKAFEPMPSQPALVGLTSGARAVDISGSRHTFAGPVLSSGSVRVTGSNSHFQCGVYAASLYARGGARFSSCPAR